MNQPKTRLSWEERAKVRDDIKNLYFVRCFSEREIASSLKLKVAVVERYIERIRSAQRALVNEHKNVFDDVHNWVYDIEAQAKHIIRVSWNEFTKSKATKERMACVDRVIKATEMRIHLLQSMGIAPKVEPGSNFGAGKSITYKSHLKADGTIQTEVEVKETKEPTQIVEVKQEDDKQLEAI